MAIKIQNTTVIDDDKNVFLNKLYMSDRTYINKLPGGLRFQLDNPNINSVGAPNEQFGYSVATDGNYIVVGAPYEYDGAAAYAGAVYIIDATSLQVIRMIQPTSAVTFEFFGISVGISNDRIIIGSSLGADNSGKAFIYNLNGQLLWTLTNPNYYDSVAGDNFAKSVSISGDYAIVGAWGEYNTVGDVQAGKAYIFNVNTGALIHALDNPGYFNSPANDEFGRSVAIDGNYAVVGSPLSHDSLNNSDSGIVYVFNVTDGTLIRALENPNVTAPSSDEFGSSVAIDGNYIIVGAKGTDSAEWPGTGKAYIFNTTTGALLWTLNNPNNIASDNFGYSVAISGDYALVGGPLIDKDNANSGVVYVYRVSTGQLLESLVNPSTYSTSYNDNFGYSVAISNNKIIIGAKDEDTNDANGPTNGPVPLNSGVIHIYERSNFSYIKTIDNPNFNVSVTGGSSYYDQFGRSVAVSGNYAIIGAPYESTSEFQSNQGQNSGIVYIFNVMTGQLVHILTNPNPYNLNQYDNFGSSVAISGNYAIIGAPSEDDGSTGSNSGKAYIYNVTTGQLVWTLNNPNAYSTSFADNFGISVAISGNYAVVGAHYEDDDPVNGINSGKAYIFNVTTGQLVYVLDNPNYYGTSGGDNFGISVAISGNYAIVGAYTEDDGPTGSGSGKAYIYNVTTGQLLHALSNPNYYGTSADDNFGRSVAISGNYAIVGVPFEDDITALNGLASGKAYVFNVTTGELILTLDNPNYYGTSIGDNFGSSVAISGNYAIVSAYLEDDGPTGSGSGKAYIFNIASGQLIYTLNNPNAYGTSADDYFGWSVAISGNYAVVGAHNEDDVKSLQSGKVYVFNLHSPQIATASSFNGLEKLIDNQTIQTNRNTLLHILRNPNAYSTAINDYFGNSVAISGNYAIVGAWQEDQDSVGTNSGKAYIYNVTTGQLLWTLNNPNYYNTAQNDYFGVSVAISGNYAIVGAHQEDDGPTGSNSGKAYVFNVATGALVHAFSNPNYFSLGENDNFGQTVAISGNYALVGAQSEDDDNGTTSGKVYVFDIRSGSLVHALNNPNYYDTSLNDNFGISLGISNNYAIIAASAEDDADGTGSGKVYIFDIITGSLVHALDNPNLYGSSVNDSFGSSVAISNNYAIVGAYLDDSINGTDSGKAYIYNVKTGHLLHILSNPNYFSTRASDNFGSSVAISGNYAVVGADNEDDPAATWSGVFYIFNVVTGQLLYTITNPNPNATSNSDDFASVLAISGNYLIVGATNEDELDSTNSGAAYIYYINNYNSLEDKLLSLFN